MIKKKSNTEKSSLKSKQDLSSSNSQVDFIYPNKINRISDYLESKNL